MSRERIAPMMLFYLLYTVTALCGVQIGLPGSPKHVQSYRLIFLHLISLIISLRIAALMLPFLPDAAIKEKTQNVWTDAIPHTIEDHRLLQEIWI